MKEQNKNFMQVEGTPQTEAGVTETTTSDEKTPIEKNLEKLENEGKIPKVGEEVKEGKEQAKEKEKLTPEQEDALTKHKAGEEAKQKEELEKKQKAYQMLQQGAYFMKFIYDDIERQKRENLNRSQRRRFSKDLRKGTFSKELIEVYAGKIDQAIDWIEQNLNNPEQTKNKIATHYHTNGFENAEFLKAILEDFFKGQFLLPGEEPEEVDGEKYLNDLKEKEVKKGK